MFLERKKLQRGLSKWNSGLKPRSVYALNETTFLVTYLSGIWTEDICSAIRKINEWLGKPVVITCNEVTAVQIPQVMEHAYHILELNQ